MEGYFSLKNYSIVNYIIKIYLTYNRMCKIINQQSNFLNYIFPIKLFQNNKKKNIKYLNYIDFFFNRFKKLFDHLKKI
jgi:hypothetical protein